MEIKNRVKDLTNVEFGDLKVLKYSGIRTFKGKSNSALWKCNCKCGDSIILTRKQLHAPAIKAYSWGSPNCKHRCKRNEDRSAKYTAYARCRASATRREYPFEIGFEEFIKISKQPCHYCGEEYSKTILSGSRKGEFKCNGLDRVNNTKGYVENNIVPCCTMCNTAKGTQHYNDFLDWIERLRYYGVS